MTIIHSIILSIVEGVTEFLPISSTGHLILASQLLQIPQTEFLKTFEICIQSGAILAIAFLYIKKLWTNKELWKSILFAFIPTAVIGFVLYKFIKSYLLGNSFITVAMLIIGGITFILFEKLWKKQPSNSIKSLTIIQAVAIGIGQSIAVIPGVSRSAMSIIVGMILGLSRTDAVEFSFFLALPTLLAATGLDLIKTNFHFQTGEYVLLFVGSIGAFISALITVRWFLKFVQSHTFIPFGIYRIVIGILFWILILR